MSIETKRCIKCDEQHIIAKFRIGRKVCKVCDNTYYKQWRLNNRQRAYELSKAGQKRRNQKGLCYSCLNPKLPLGRHCTKHSIHSLLITIRDRIKGNFAAGDLLNSINILSDKITNNPFCPYTGDYIALSCNAHLDHIIPISRRTDLALDVNNLQWVSSRYNQAKHSMTDKEFLAFCHLIVYKAQKKDLDV